jgi:hypothetical protein
LKFSAGLKCLFYTCLCAQLPASACDEVEKTGRQSIIRQLSWTG